MNSETGSFEAASFFQAVMQNEELKKITESSQSFITGIWQGYTHPYRRTLEDPPVLWQKGAVRLLDYGFLNPRSRKVLLVIPSLINNAHILDLTEESSFLRWLARHKIRPLLLDWGEAGQEERGFSLSDYLVKIILPCLDALKRPVMVAGHCAGGLLALGAAMHRFEQIQALALLATPWNTAVEPEKKLLSPFVPFLEYFTKLPGKPDFIPPEALQLFFMLRHLPEVIRKYQKFQTLDQESEEAKLFAAVELWLRSKTPLSTRVAAEIYQECYRENLPFKGLWSLAGRLVVPELWQKPALIVAPLKDQVVSWQSAGALAKALPRAELFTPNVGHVGMLAGKNAETEVWPPILKWLSEAGKLQKA